MVIAYQSSELFSSICMVSLYSALANNTEEDDIYIYILSKDFSANSLNNVKNMLESFGFNRENAEVIDISNLDKRFDIMFDNYNKKWEIDSFCKLLLAKLLPISQNRVLYLDSDTIICRNLHDFYHMDLEEYALAAVKDFINSEYFEYFGLNSSDVYCNSGILLINLVNWRKMKIEDAISEYLHHQKGCVFFSEQTVLNVVCRGKIKIVELEYNLTSIPVCLNRNQIKLLRNPYNAYSDKEIEYAKTNPCIIHFTSLFLILGRAWHEQNNHPLKKYFDYYATKVPKISTNKPNKRKVVQYRLMKLIPKTMLCTIVGFYYKKGRIKKYENYKNMFCGNKRRHHAI